MIKKDFLQRFIFDNAPIRGEIVHIEESFQAILQQHQYPEPIKQLLGEALCVAALLSAIIKFDGRLTVQFRGKGSLQLLLAQCDNQFHIRGLVKWEGELSYIDLMNALEEGVLVIMLDSGSNKTRYQGIVAWDGKSLAESIEKYFMHSEQLSTKIWLTVGRHRAAGLLLQIVPGTNKQFGELEQDIIDPQWQRITELATHLTPGKLLKEDNEVFLQDLFPEEMIRVFPENKIEFHCTCSRQRSIDAIQILGREEAEEEIQEKQTILVTCDFCNKEYIFNKDDISAIFDDHSRPPGTSLH